MFGGILGKKMGMTRIFKEDGTVVPVTVVKAGPCVVVQKKSVEKDGYNAIQVGFEHQKASRVNKPLKGHFDKAGKGYFKYLREFRVDNIDEFELGQEIKVDIFKIGEKVNVSGRSKGKGFTGVIKRWGFSRGRETHGSRSHRVPGSIGASTNPGRVVKGKKLPGRKGFEMHTIKNLEIVDVRPEMDILAIKGAVPGPKNGLLLIKKVQ